MTSAITGFDAAVLNATLAAVFALTTWAVLWPLRSRAVDFWCIGGLLFAIASAMVVIARPLMQEVATSPYLVLTWSAPASGLARLSSVRQLVGRRNPPRPLAAFGILHLLLCVGLSGHVETRQAFAVFSVAVGLTLSLGAAWFALRISRDYGVPSGGLLAMTLTFTSVSFLTGMVSTPLLHLDPSTTGLVPSAIYVPLVLFGTLSTACNAMLFVGVVMGVTARRLEGRERELAMSEERLRLIADLHDGFGSQLATARIRLERAPATSADIATLLEECLADLYLIVDTAQNVEGRLEDALRFLRHRVAGRLREGSTAITWDLQLSGAPPMPQWQMLQVLRMAQEALTNALRHARARTIHVNARYEPPAGLVLVIADDGGGMPADRREGRGLGGLRSRARELGAGLAITSSDTGTQVCITLPGPG